MRQCHALKSLVGLMVLGSVSILLGSVSILIGKFLLVWDLRGWRRPAEDYPRVQGEASETG